MWPARLSLIRILEYFKHKFLGINCDFFEYESSFEIKSGSLVSVFIQNTVKPAQTTTSIRRPMLSQPK